MRISAFVVLGVVLALLMSVVPISSVPLQRRKTIVNQDGSAYGATNSLEGMCDQAQLIIQAHVQTMFPARDKGEPPPGFPYLETDFILQVDRVLKGSNSIREVAVTQRGGINETQEQEVVGFPLMKIGEDRLFFLTGPDGVLKADGRPEVPNYQLIYGGAGTMLFELNATRLHSVVAFRAKYEGRAPEFLISDIQSHIAATEGK